MKIGARTVAVVTGSNRAKGIGFALVQELLKRGCQRVVGSYNREEQSAALLELAEKDERVLAHKLDLTDSTSAKAFADFCLKSLPKIDLLINNTGMGGTGSKSILEADIKEYEDKLQVHVVGPLRLTQLLWPLLQKGDVPVIVNVSSNAGRMSSIGRGSLFYGPAKAAQNAMSIQLAAHLGQTAIVIPIHPGWVSTDMGGENAPILPAESASGILNYVESARSEDSGRFVDFTGKSLSWL
jgi:NAD(P)-dependent dehydrogenase (short-subunit alcohol dehydrogenase family)